MKEPFRLLIAVPSTDYMHAEFVRSLMKLTGHLQREGIRHETEIIAGTLVYLARDKLACTAINDGYTHMLFLDSDMVFGEDIVETLRFSGSIPEPEAAVWSMRIREPETAGEDPGVRDPAVQNRRVRHGLHDDQRGDPEGSAEQVRDLLQPGDVRRGEIRRRPGILLESEGDREGNVVRSDREGRAYCAHPDMAGGGPGDIRAEDERCLRK